jgi:hypothetical protein
MIAKSGMVAQTGVSIISNGIQQVGMPIWIPSTESKEVWGYEYNMCGTKDELFDTEMKWPPINGQQC